MLSITTGLILYKNASLYRFIVFFKRLLKFGSDSADLMLRGSLVDSNEVNAVKLKFLARPEALSFYGVKWWRYITKPNYRSLERESWWNNIRCSGVSLGSDKHELWHLSIVTCRACNTQRVASSSHRWRQRSICSECNTHTHARKHKHTNTHRTAKSKETLSEALWEVERE